MYDLIRQLPPVSQRVLLRLIDASTAADEFDDAEIAQELRRELRLVLAVPEDGDLPEYCRRRLVEVARRDFGLGPDLDDASDLDLARELVDYALAAAAKLARSPQEREEFALFLKTKDVRERHRWLVASHRLRDLTEDRFFDRAAASQAADALLSEPNAYRATAKQLVTDLGKASIRSSAFRRAAAGSVMATSSVALPLGAVAGGLYMAGKGKSAAAKAAKQQETKERARRARRSRMVQTLMSICAFLVIEADQPDGPAG